MSRSQYWLLSQKNRTVQISNPTPDQNLLLPDPQKPEQVKVTEKQIYSFFPQIDHQPNLFFSKSFLKRSSQKQGQSHLS